MATQERRLTEPVDLCLSDGRTLNPEAVGWSPQPVHRANLSGGWGRTKRWDYWALLSDEMAISLTFADVDYLGIVAVWWCDLRTGETGGRELVVPFARGISLPERPGWSPLRFRNANLGLEVVDEAAATRITARWREPDGRIGRLDAEVALPVGHGSVNVVIPWSPTRFQYTSKHQARPARASIGIGDEVRNLGAAAPLWGVLDVGRGRWPYRTRWNWGGGAGTSRDGRTVGLQFGGKWTEGTGATENGVIIDGEVLKLGDELVWQYDWSAPTEPWWVRSTDGALDVTLVVAHDRHARTEALVLGTEVHQVFGWWHGRAPSPRGEPVEFDGMIGFAEESRSRW